MLKPFNPRKNAVAAAIPKKVLESEKQKSQH
jgi:hypothetical protein